MFCSISAVTPQEPVLSKTGYVFERRLIEEHIQRLGTCPVTKEPLTENDLIDIKVNRTVRPRTVTSTSIPSLLQTFQNEWDAVMVETFELRKQLDQCRTELATALYKQDAAERTIARLIRERDQAQNEARSMVGARRSGPAPEEEDESTPMEIEGGGLSKELSELFSKTASALIEKRKVRVVAPTTASPKEVGAFREVGTTTPVSASKKGLTALAVDLRDTAAVGSADGPIALFNYVSGKESGSLLGHEKAVNALQFVSGAGGSNVLLSGSSDSTVKIWADSGKGFTVRNTLSTVHSGPVTGLSVHPCKSLFISSSADCSWALSDLHSGATVYSVATSGEAVSCISFHPDGLLAGTASEDAQFHLRLWDIKTKDNVLSYPHHKARINSLVFSENGFYMATGSSDSTVKLWDLRKLNAPVFAEEGHDGEVFSVAFDHSGEYLAAGGKDVKLFHVKTASSTVDQIARLSSHKAPVTAVGWDNDARRIFSVSSDRSLKTWSK